VPVEAGVHALEIVEAASRAARFDRTVSIAEIRQFRVQGAPFSVTDSEGSHD
jgi:hypothetical protein